MQLSVGLASLRVSTDCTGSQFLAPRRLLGLGTILPLTDVSDTSSSPTLSSLKSARSAGRLSRRQGQQLRDVPFQVAVGRNANGVFHALFLQRLVDLRPGKGRITPGGDLLSHLLLPLDLRQQELLPAFGAVRVAGP